MHSIDRKKVGKIKKELFNRFNLINIAVALAYHVLFIGLAAVLMSENCVILLDIALAADAIYLIYWIVGRIKTYMPWIVYIAFTVGGAIEVVLNFLEIIPLDNKGGWFAGIGQYLYEMMVIAFVILLGVVNLAKLGIFKLRQYLKKVDEELLIEIEEERQASENNSEEVESI